MWTRQTLALLVLLLTSSAQLFGCDDDGESDRDVDMVATVDSSQGDDSAAEETSDGTSEDTPADDAAEVSSDVEVVEGHVAVDGDITARITCDMVCAERGLICPGDYEHVAFGTIGGVVDWEGVLTGLDCDETPEATHHDPFTGGTYELTSYVCYCSSQ